MVDAVVPCVVPDVPCCDSTCRDALVIKTRSGCRILRPCRRLDVANSTSCAGGGFKLSCFLESLAPFDLSEAEQSGTILTDKVRSDGDRRRQSAEESLLYALLVSVPLLSLCVCVCVLCVVCCVLCVVCCVLCVVCCVLCVVCCVLCVVCCVRFRASFRSASRGLADSKWM